MIATESTGIGNFTGSLPVQMLSTLSWFNPSQQPRTTQPTCSLRLQWDEVGIRKGRSEKTHGL